jgi:hypothetical protein
MIAVHECRTTDRRDDGSEIFDLAVDRVWNGVTTCASASTIVGDSREVFCQLRSQRRARRSIIERAANQDERRSLTRPIERDDGAVLRRPYP